MSEQWTTISPAPFAEPDKDEREASILYALSQGVACEDVARTADEARYCERMRPGIEQMRLRGVMLDLSDTER